MEAIKRFEYELDLSNCDKLYDYVNRKEYLRPGTGWDLALIQEESRLTNYPHLSKKDKTRIKCIEESHREAGLLEKDPEKKHVEKESKELEKVSEGVEALDTSSMFDSNDKLGILYGKGMLDSFSPMGDSYSLPLWVLPVFYPGDRVRGKLHLELSEPLPAEQLGLEFIGRAGTTVMVHTGKGSYPDVGREAFVEEKNIYWHKDGVSCTEGAVNLALPVSDVLPVGAHVFTYDYRIPSDAPASIQPLIPEKVKWGDYAHLTYFLKAKIDQGKMFKRGNIVLFRGIWVEKAIDIARDPDNMYPFTTEEMIKTGVFNKSGNIYCKVTLQGKGALRLGSVLISVEINNETDEEIKEVAARLQLTGKYTAKASKWHVTNKFCAKGDEETRGPVLPGMSRHHMELTVDFNDGCIDGYLAPAGTEPRCTIIETAYELFVEIRRAALKSNLKMHIPINVGNRNSKSME